MFMKDYKGFDFKNGEIVLFDADLCRQYLLTNMVHKKAYFTKERLSKCVYSWNHSQNVISIIIAEKGRSKFSQNAGATLLHYIRDQKAKVKNISDGKVYDSSDPRYDLCLRHEADKLDMLQNLAIDAGYDGEFEQNLGTQSPTSTK